MSEQEDQGYTERIVIQLSRVRFGKRVNMFDLEAVQTEAHEMNLKDLWEWLESLRRPESAFHWDTDLYGKALSDSIRIGINEQGRPVRLEEPDYTGL